MGQHGSQDVLGDRRSVNTAGCRDGDIAGSYGIVQQMFRTSAVELNPAQAGCKFQNIGRQVESIEDLSFRVGGQRRSDLLSIMAGTLSDTQPGRNAAERLEKILLEAERAENLDIFH
jgi:hypothetical protein